MADLELFLFRKGNGNPSRIGCDLADAALGGAGNINPARVALRQDDLGREEGSRDRARVGGDRHRCCVASVKGNVSCVRFDLQMSRCDQVRHLHVACVCAQICRSAGNIVQYLSTR